MVHGMALNSNSWAPAKRRTARVALLGAQVVFGVACLVGTFVGVTWVLSGATEPAAPEVRFAKAENWPEIKGGVPELVSPAALIPSSGIPIAELPLRPQSGAGAASDAPVRPDSNPPTEAELAPPEPPSENSTVGKKPPVAEAAASPAEAPQADIPAENGRPGPMAKDDTSRHTLFLDGIQAQSSAAPPPATPPGQEVASTSESPAQPLAASTPISDTGIVQEPPDPTPVSAGKEAALPIAATAPTPYPGVASPSVGQGRRVERSARAASDVRRASVEQRKRRVPAEAKTARTEQRKAKATPPARTRTAEAKPSPTPDPAPAPAPPAEVREERVHLLGVPLPTGRKIRECLLEFRC